MIVCDRVNWFFNLSVEFEVQTTNHMEQSDTKIIVYAYFN